MHSAVSVPEGNSVALTVTWTALLNDTPEAPTAVSYQVFDARTNAAVSTEQSVPDPAPTMTIVVGPAHLPVAGAKRRDLVVRIRGEFNTDIHTEKVYLSIEKMY